MQFLTVLTAYEKSSIYVGLKSPPKLYHNCPSMEGKNATQAATKEYRYHLHEVLLPPACSRYLVRRLQK